MSATTAERPAQLTQRQAAAILGIKKGSMQRLVEAGTLAPVRIAGLARPRYRRADIEALVRGESP